VFVGQTTSLNPAFSPRRRRNVRRVFGILNDGIGRTVAGITGMRKGGSFSWGRLELLGKQRKEFGAAEGPQGRTSGSE